MRKLSLVVAVLACAVACTTSTSGHPRPAGSTPDTSVDGKVNTLDDVAVGDCVEFIDPPPAGVEVGTIDCAEPMAVYEVAAELPSPTGTCPSDRYDSYTQTGQDEFTLCLMLNAEVGDCFDGLLTGATGPERADCASAESVVTTVLSDTADEGACPADTRLPLAYPEPAPGRTVCVAGQ